MTAIKSFMVEMVKEFRINSEYLGFTFIIISALSSLAYVVNWY